MPDGLRFIDNHDGTALIIGQLDYDLVDPDQANDYSVDVTVRDEFNGTDIQGFSLTVNDADPPRVDREVTVSIGVPEPLPGVAVDIPIGTEITVPMDVKFEVNISIETSEGQTISSRDFRSEDGLIEFSMPVDLQPNMVYRVIESYMGKAVPDTPFSLPTFDFELEDQVWDFTSDDGTGAIPYQVEVQASVADLLTLVVGDFASSARIHGILPDMVDLELESTKDIPADTPIQFGSGFTLDFSRDVNLRVVCDLRGNKLKYAAIILASGRATRMSGVDKMMTVIGGKPLISFSIEAFLNCKKFDQICITVNNSNKTGVKRIIRRYGSDVIVVAIGGARRQDSVKNGLDMMKP